ncbi:MAG: PAS domain S-box protein, partial [Chloroflexi bacterium]|nr:PAS domain S-box protein [Chloroflexota bacterium]
ITERKKAEEALSREKERAQKYLDIAGVMIVAIDANQTVTLINRKAAEILGYSQNEIIGKNWFDNFIPERIRSGVKTTFDKLMAGDLESAEYYENPVLTAGGKERIIEWRNTTCRDESGNITGTLSSGNDITERKTAEQALLESERHYAALAKNLTDAVFLFKNGIITWCNDKVEEIYGYPKKELLGKHASFFYPQDIAPSKFAKTVSTSLRERGSFRDTAMFRKKDNSIIYLEYSLSLMSGEDSVEIIAVARDITERERAEEVLRESEANYRELADSISDVFFAMEENLRYVYWNKASEALTGIKAIDVMGKQIFEVFPDNDPTRRTADIYRKALAEQRPQTFVTEYNLKGKNYFFEIFAYPSKSRLSVFVRDITQRKQVEKARERLLAELEEKTRELEQIVYVTSHDLRSPLVNIQGFTRELDQSFKEINEVLKNNRGISPQLRKRLKTITNEDTPHAIQYILTSSAKMDSLLSGLLRLSRLGRAALNIRQLDMNRLMADVVASVEFQ